MQQDLDVTEAAVWSTADVAQLAELAEQLRWLARPHVYEAVRQPAMISTVRELPADAPLRDLARAVAENTLRRVVRAGRFSHSLDAPDIGSLSEEALRFACNLALSELTDDALHDLRILARTRYRTGHLDG